MITLAKLLVGIVPVTLFVLVLLSNASTAHAFGTSTAYTCDREFFVATNGSDSNDGSSGSPWRSIKESVVKAGLGAGDCVTVRDGVYNEGAISIGRGGSADTADGYFVLRSENSKGAVIRGGSSYITLSVDEDYVIVDGFNVDGGVTTTGHGIACENNHYVKIINNLVHDQGGSGVACSWGEFFHIEGNIVYNNAREDWFSGIGVYQAQNSTGDTTTTGPRVIIRNNISFNNVQWPDRGFHTDGNGIIIDDFYQTQDNDNDTDTPYPYPTLVENNLVFGNGSKGIQIVWSGNVTIRNNTAYKNNRDNVNTATWRGELSNNFSDDNTWVNNIAWTDPSINENNTAIGNQSNSGSDPYWGEITNVQWYNNLTFNGTPGEASIDQENSSVAITAAEGNILGVDPEFGDPGWTMGADFSLLPGSPAIGVGTSSFGYHATDLSGAARNPSAIDLGAGPSSNLDSTNPSAPTISFDEVGDDSIALDWTPATDNLGVDYYEVERCTGSGCSSFAQIATSSVSAVVSSVSAETTYRFRARTRDVAGNYSVYSNIISTTSLAVSASTGETIWGNTIPSYTDAYDNVQYELGAVFTPTVAGDVTSIRFYVADNESGSHTARLWNNASGTVISGPHTLSVSSAGWHTYTLPATVTLTASTTYTVSVTTGVDAGYSYVYSALSTSGTNGAFLTYASTSGVFTSTLGQRPTQNFGSHYFRDIVFVASTSDATAPVVSLSSPSDSSTVSGASVTVSASASDNVAVSGVQFKLDGANLGSEDTAAPYAVVWDSTLSSDGTHQLTAVARDAVGNIATATTRTVTVSNASSGGSGGGGGGGGNRRRADASLASSTPVEGGGDTLETRRLLMLELIALMKQLIGLLQLLAIQRAGG